jgi:hypothetical protein
MNNILTPPIYCPTAIATDAGWVNPKSGELLMAIRNLKQRIAEAELASAYQATLPVVIEEPIVHVAEPEPEPEPVIEDVIEIEPEPVSDSILGKNHTLAIIDDIGLDDQVKKPKQRGRPKKVK